MKNGFLYLFILFTLCVAGQTTSVISGGIEHDAQNVGGKKEFERFVAAHMIYPETALTNKTEGKVIINCIITDKGEAIHLQIIKHVSPDLDSEALRLFKLLKWEPGLSPGKVKKAISMELSVGFEFKIAKYKKNCKKRGFESSKFTDKPADTSGIVYTKADTPPVFYYGKDSLLHYIQTHLNYPELAKHHNIEGKVIVGFIVETNGMISNLTTETDLGGGCKEEAISVMEPLMWTPAVLQGKYVRFKYSYPIVFKLENVVRDNIIKEQRQQ